MEEEQKTTTWSGLSQALLVFVFVWGSLWLGTYSLKTGGSNIRENIAVAIGKSSIIMAGVADAVPSPTPIQTSTQTPLTSPIQTTTIQSTPTPAVTNSSPIIPTPTPAVTTFQNSSTPTPTPTPANLLFEQNPSPIPTTTVNPTPTPSPIIPTKIIINKSSPTPTVSPSSNPKNVRIIKTMVAGQIIESTSTPSSIETTTNNDQPTNFAVTSTSSLKIIIGGDVMMDRAVRNLGQKFGYDSLFKDVKPLFDSADIVAVNLEGPITSNTSKTLLPDGHTTDSLTFTFDPVSTSALSKAGIDLVSLANNHSDNFGLAGIAETKKNLTKSNIKWFGDYKNASSTEAVITKNNISVAFVGYHAFQPGFDKVVANVRELSAKGYFVIVMPHWGEEYASSTTKMRAQARTLVANGASAIFGSHPHIILEHSAMGDIPVFYSLGNLLFDQYFSTDVMSGNVVEINLSKNADKVKIDNIQIYKTSTASHRGITIDSNPVDF